MIPEVIQFLSEEETSDLKKERLTNDDVMMKHVIHQILSLLNFIHSFLSHVIMTLRIKRDKLDSDHLTKKGD